MRVAAHQHRDHHRKSSDLPYITHPSSVALILQRAGFDDDALIAAALLHDAVEDTDYEVDQLEKEFPPAVVEYVMVATERKLDDDGSKRTWRDRKTEHLEQVAAGPLPARALVLADKLHNLGSMLFDLTSGEDIWPRFGASKEEMLDYHRQMVARAAGEDEELQPLAEACRDLVMLIEGA